MLPGRHLTWRVPSGVATEAALPPGFCAWLASARICSPREGFGPADGDWRLCGGAVECSSSRVQSLQQRQQWLSASSLAFADDQVLASACPRAVPRSRHPLLSRQERSQQATCWGPAFRIRLGGCSRRPEATWVGHGCPRRRQLSTACEGPEQAFLQFSLLASTLCVLFSRA